ncbi:protein argonaute 16-like [Rhododendron vialii]|uniref:protein argonaute 16-like n=1 Tax=Rhododendron vialii TaxID=182163 RepID=UPI00265EFA74|nr:protein argonaute 16-like [Rhododendron vialii]
MEKEAGGSPLSLPPRPAIKSPTVKPEKLDTPKHSIISRQGFGAAGRPISLVVNHFKASIKCPNKSFYQYTVSITWGDNEAVLIKGLKRKVVDKLYQTYFSELAGRRYAYDGEQSLYTVGPLHGNRLEFAVVLEESFAKRDSSSHRGNNSEYSKRSKHSFQPKIFKVEISYAAKIPLRSISLALQGSKAKHAQDPLRVLDTILQQQASDRGCLLVRQSFFHDDPRNFTDIGGGVTRCQGLYSSFRATHGGLSLNMDVSATMIVTPGPVIDFLLAKQDAKKPCNIDWAKEANEMLKTMRVRTRHTNMEFRIVGLSEMPCNQQYFSWKVKNGDGGDDGEKTVEISVYEYFAKHHKIQLTYSADMPCLNVSRKSTNCLPLELCNLVSFQRYTKELSPTQRASLLDKSRQEPQECIQALTNAVRNCRFDSDPLLAACGISIEKQLTQVDGRVLEAPRLKFGKGEDCIPQNGRWNYYNKQLLNPIPIEWWAVINFSTCCDTSHLSRELINCARNKGLHIKGPHTLIEEDPRYGSSSPVVRVEKMFEKIVSKFPSRRPQFLLCILPERKTSDIYGPWKKICLCDKGIATQCLSPSKININGQYLTNVILKINAKLGGINSLLAIEIEPFLGEPPINSWVPLIKDTPTMILGMDVSHGPSGSNTPSIASVVGSLSWPLISRYRAAVRTQSPKVEMIESLFKPLANGGDDGIMRELLMDFYLTSAEHKPAQIILFRDGVSESQFNQVLTGELDDIIKAYKHLGKGDIPKFTVIVAQKRHHTKLFQERGSKNVPPGTIVDTKIVHPRSYDFYMCAHAGMIGTSRPAHYHVLLDEIGFSPDQLQDFVHSLSYIYQRSTTAISIVAPVKYAHHAAKQMGQFVNFEDSSGSPSERKGSPAAPKLPRLHKDVARSMFFC